MAILTVIVYNHVKKLGHEKVLVLRKSMKNLLVLMALPKKQTLLSSFFSLFYAALHDLFLIFG